MGYLFWPDVRHGKPKELHLGLDSALDAVRTRWASDLMGRYLTSRNTVVKGPQWIWIRPG